MRAMWALVRLRWAQILLMPPMVVAVTSPSSHRMIRTTAMV